MFPERPVLKLEASRVERVADGIAALGLLVIVGSAVGTFLWVDGPVPTHMNAAGKPDAWGGKGTLLFLPLVTLVPLVTFQLLRRAPHTFNYPVAITPENAPRLYRLGRELVALMGAAVAWTFALIAASFAAIAAGISAPAAPWLLPVTLGITFVPLAVYVRKMLRAG